MKACLPILLCLTMIQLAPAQSGKSTLHGSAPAWANGKNFQGTADPTAQLGFRVYLGWNNPANAVALAQAVSDPKSSSYRQFLTPQQFRQQFAPSQSQVGAVQAWLQSQGFSLVYTPSNNHYVSAKGSVGQAQQAFGAQMSIYKVNGKSLRSPAADVSIPSTLAGIVTGVVGLDQSAALVHTNHVVDTNAPPPGGFRNAPPQSDYWAQLLSPYSFPKGYTDLMLPSVPWVTRGYTPAQIKGAYGISGYDGKGQTVAIIDAYAAPTIVQDVNQWSTNRGLPTMSAGQFVQVIAPGTYNVPENPKQDPQGWYGEETLDVEAIHGMAPAAKIVYVGAPNNYQDLDAAMNHVVDKGLAQIVSNSYGFNTELLPAGFVKPMEDTLIQAVIEGIGVYFSSGDNGDESSAFGFATTEYPTSSPWVTAVGGTSLGIGKNNNRVIETGWGTSNYTCNSNNSVCTFDSWFYGAGGGVSRVFAEPSYQTNAGLSFTGRGVPDVAAVADIQTGLLIGETQTFPNGTYYDEYRIGGTSLACPTFAGLMALADQAAGQPHGFANPAFYANASAFYDVRSTKTAVTRRNYVNSVDATAGTADFLRTFDDYTGSSSQHTNAGWDNVTGLGTPTDSFLKALGK